VAWLFFCENLAPQEGCGVTVPGAPGPVRVSRLLERGIVLFSFSAGPAAPIGVWFQIAVAGHGEDEGVANSEPQVAREHEAKDELEAEIYGKLTLSGCCCAW